MAAARVWEALANVRIAHPMVKWLPLNKLHLTLVFLGQTNPGRVPALTAAMEKVADGRPPFDVTTGDAGGRLGGQRGGVLWLRLDSGGHEVAQLSLDLDEALGSSTYNEKAAPRPHLTVARGVTDSALADLRVVAQSIELGWTVDRIVLFRSYTDPGGSRYEELASSLLSG
jgi:2'-5' RNA ligase